MAKNKNITKTGLVESSLETGHNFGLTDLSAFKYVNAMYKTKSGVSVSPTKSMSLSAYYACMKNIAEDLGKMPLHIFSKDENDNKTLLLDNDIHQMFTMQPNPDMSPMTLKEVVTAHAVGWGNGYAEIIRNGRGKPKRLYPIHPSNVVISRREDLTIWYKVTKCDSLGRTMETVEIPARNMLHIKGLGPDGLSGYSPAYTFAKESLGTALATQQFGGAFFGNGSQHGGILMYPNALKRESVDKLTDSWDKRHKGSDNAFKIAVLEEGMKWQSTSIPPKEAQFLEVRQFQVEDVCRWFRMPPHKVQHLLRSTFNNIEQQNIDYVTDTLQPWIIRWEEEVQIKLLNSDPRKFASFQFQSLLRGDSKSRAAYYKAMVNLGAMTPNEVRKFEDMNPGEQFLDEYFMQANITTVKSIAAGNPNNASQNQPTVSSPEEDLGEKPSKEEKPGAILFSPLIKKALETADNKESKARHRATNKGEEYFNSWQQDFYASHSSYAYDLVSPIVETYLTVSGKEVESSVALVRINDKIKDYCSAQSDIKKEVGLQSILDSIILNIDNN